MTTLICFARALATGFEHNCEKIILVMHGTDCFLIMGMGRDDYFFVCICHEVLPGVSLLYEEITLSVLFVPATINIYICNRV